MKKNNKDSDIVRWSQIKSWINHFISNIPVFTIKGFILFLGVGLITICLQGKDVYF